MKKMRERARYFRVFVSTTRQVGRMRRQRRWLDRVFFEETCDHRRIEIGPDTVDGVSIEVEDPAVSVVEPHSVLRRGQGVKFHDSLVVLHEQMLDDELSPIGQNLAELREGPGQEIRFRLVVTGQRMRAFDDPVDLVVYMLEKARAIAVLEPFENLSDVVFGDHQILQWIREQLLARRRTDRPAPKLGTEPTLVIAGISVLTLRFPTPV